MNAWINKSTTLLTTDKNSYVEGKEREGMCLELGTYFELETPKRLLNSDAQK